jgi:predicted TIM-barrel fold metal-dependent hydrolase
MSRAWSVVLDDAGSHTEEKAVPFVWHPGRAKTARPGDAGIPGSDPAVLVEQLFDGDDLRRDRVVLAYDEGRRCTTHANHHLAQVMTRAANDWTIEEWLPHDDRLYGLVLVSTALVDEAVAEVRRAGECERMVGVQLGGAGLGRPFGHPAYRPIFAAAADMGLPIVLEAWADATGDAMASPVIGGYPSTYAEYRSYSWHSHSAHTSSLVIGGVFNDFEELKVLLIGGGATWFPGHMWRLDYWYKKNARREAQWLRKLPSEYCIDHFRLATYDLETPSPELLSKALKGVPTVEEMFLYTSCYPNIDSDDPQVTATRLPASWHRGVFVDNPIDFFRWPSARETASGRAAETDSLRSGSGH